MSHCRLMSDAEGDLALSVLCVFLCVYYELSVLSSAWLHAFLGDPGVKMQCLDFYIG